MVWEQPRKEEQTLGFSIKQNTYTRYTNAIPLATYSYIQQIVICKYKMDLQLNRTCDLLKSSFCSVLLSINSKIFSSLAPKQSSSLQALKFCCCAAVWALRMNQNKLKAQQSREQQMDDNSCTNQSWMMYEYKKHLFSSSNWVNSGGSTTELLHVSWQPFFFSFLQTSPTTSSHFSLFGSLPPLLCLSIKVMVVFALICRGTTRAQNSSPVSVCFAAEPTAPSALSGQLLLFVLSAQNVMK